jgi:hypothetical protein
MTDFRTVARTLRPFISDTYNLLDAADAVVGLPTPTTPAVAPPHDLLVFAALGNGDVMDAVRDGKRINAIKELRSLWPASLGGLGVGINLKAAKEAIEDARVMEHFNEYHIPEPLAEWEKDLLSGNPWDARTDEPPF